jgi:hypothetical protein
VSRSRPEDRRAAETWTRRARKLGEIGFQERETLAAAIRAEAKLFRSCRVRTVIWRESAGAF